ncbi:MAG: HD domain-containing protein [Candidatus Bathyarchaeota archaeon]|nr:HD domain-containing protein [Candidatus Bathyarchaeota archaeon]
MNERWLMKKVKYGDFGSEETFIEHAIKTFHVGKYLYEQIKPSFDREEFLYCCAFHDVGKVLAKPGTPHTHRSRESLSQIAKTKEYKTILRAFNLEDFSENDHVVRAIEKHHDSDESLGAFTSIADQIASSESDEQLKNRLKASPISTLITYLNEMHSFSDKHFYYVKFYSFSKNELNALGRLILLKLLYETIEQLPEVTLLYETLDGCRIVTKLFLQELKTLLARAFNKNLAKFIENQNLKDILGGAPDNYAQFTNLPKEIKPRLLELTVQKYAEDIVQSLRKKGVNNIEDVGLGLEVLTRFVNLPEIAYLSKKGIKGISKTKYYLFGDENGLFSKWVVGTFFVDKESRFKGKLAENSAPLLEQLLSKAGADVSKITCKKEVYSKLFPLVVAVNSLNESKVDFCFDISNYIAIDGEISLEKIARENTCANCGVFEGEVELTPFIFEYKQHAKETLFKETEDEFRHREKVVCGLCQVEAMLNTLLCGTVLEGMQARINTNTHIIFCSLGITKSDFEDMASFQDQPIQKLMERFRITKHSVYLKKSDDLQYLIMSVRNSESGIANATFQRLLFSSIAANLQQRYLVLAIGVNKIPTFFDDSCVQFNDGQIPIIDDIRTDFFRFVYIDSNLPPKEQKNLVLQYVDSPFIGIAQIFKKSNQKYTETIKELVDQMTKNDQLLSITDKIWEMAKIGGSLETKKNVGSFLVGFNGSPRALDVLVNRLLKNSLLNSEKRKQIIEIHEKLRQELESMDDKQRAQLKNYIQKTKYLFNSKKFYEIGQEGGMG